MSSKSGQKKSKTPHEAPPPSAPGDARFSQFKSDPRYRLPRRKDTHVKVDKRFARMFDDDDFTKKAKVDRYGRKISSEAGRKALKKLYDVESDDGEAEEEADDDDEIQAELDRLDEKATSKSTSYDPARQGGFDDASSSSDDSSSDEDEEEEPESELDETLDPEAGDIPTGEVTPRLAVVNLDWDNIRAVDLMAVAQSFCPPAGRIRNVTVYPSEFGRERMQREEMEGPAPELFAQKTSSKKKPAQTEDDDSDESEDDAAIASRLKAASTDPSANADIDHRALRAYQLSRLRYYYAVITADSAATAKHLYDAMDGSEYLSSANFFDLRFVPSDTTFDDPLTDKPRDACSDVPPGYRPAEFVTDALMHSKVQLTWDADDAQRKEAQKRAFAAGAEMADGDLAAYLGSDSSDDNDDGDAAVETIEPGKPDRKDAARAKMRALLGLPAEPERRSRAKDDAPQGDMQITFTAGLSGSTGDHSSAFVNRPEDVVEETTVEKYVRKERERKARRRAKAKAARGDEPDEGETEPPAPPPKSNQQDDADPFNDPFFADPDSANKTARKDAKKLARADRESKAAASAATDEAERTALRDLLGDDAGGAHFDMAKLRKAEKAAARGKKKGKKGRAGDGEDQVQDDFKMDVGTDPRFARMLESHEYAIDPTSARYSGSKAMKGVLEQGRKRREGVLEGEGARKRKGQGEGDEAGTLVQKLKKRKG